MVKQNSLIRATVFVDWNSQIHAAKAPKNCSPIDNCRITLEFVGRSIGRALNIINQTQRYDVSLRLYHGWHKGFEMTPRRRAMKSVIASTDFISLSRHSNVNIQPIISYGDELISANISRFHNHLQCHLPNTLRYGLDGITEVEKMVDTAIASDLVDLAYSDRDQWLIVVGEDDDLIPPVFVAEGIRKPSEGKVVLIRLRRDNPFLKLNDLRVTP